MQQPSTRRHRQQNHHNKCSHASCRDGGAHSKHAPTHCCSTDTGMHTQASLTCTHDNTQQSVCKRLGKSSLCSRALLCAAVSTRTHPQQDRTMIENACCWFLLTDLRAQSRYTGADDCPTKVKLYPETRWRKVQRVGCRAVACTRRPGVEAASPTAPGRTAITETTITVLHSSMAESCKSKMSARSHRAHL